MAVREVRFGDEVLMSLEYDTVTPSDVRKGVTFHNSLGESLEGELLPPNPYEGDYEVYPHVYEQILLTKDKSMTDNVSVKEILLSEVVNPQGGTTLIIE